MICDDDPDILDMIALVLETEGLELTLFAKSIEFFKVIDKVNPDLVLLDLWMPVISGDQILKQVRRDNRYGTLPVLVMSASQDGPRIAAEAGATAFLSKPFDMDELLDTTHQLLQDAKQVS